MVQTTSGTGALANTGYGIYIHNSTDITIGGTTVAERNIISGNGKDGINTRFGTKRLNIYGNYIGVDSTGAVELGNTDNGIFLADTQTTNIGNDDPSGRNIITGNKISGIRNSTSTSTVIAGNYVGLDAAGTAALGNTLHGIYVQNSATVTIGGATAGARNIVSGNKVMGVYVVGATSNTRIEGNTIGLLADGDTAAGNTQAGIETSLTNGVVIHNNIISANKTRGIHPINSPSTTITNNIIGLNAAGTAKRANLEHGIDVDTAASDLLVESNVLSGNNKAGIRIFSGTATNNRIINNKIGVGSDGITALGNLISGVWIDSTTGVLVGGTGANDANIIAHNTGDAVTLNGTNNKANIISRNIMFANSSLGIDLDEDNVTLNNGSALSTGANEGLNFPQFKQVILEGGNLTVNGCAPAGATIELFEADVSPTSSAGVATGANQAGRTQDYGEGERYLATFVEGVGEETPTTTIDCNTLTDSDANNATGMSVFQWTIPAPSNVVLGDKLTATATLAASGTSEFSSIATVSLGNAAPEITSNGGGASAALSVAENQTAATTVTATDANPSDTLTYSISGGADAARFSINASTGVLTFNTAPDFELPTDADTNNVYEVQVTVADGNGGTDVQTISITVTDVVETVNPAFPDGVGLADSVCGVPTATSTTTDAGIYWSHNASGGTSLAAQIARTDLVVSADDEAAIGLVAQAQSGSTQVNMATIPAQYDPTKYLQYTFTTADLAGKVAELTGLSMSVYHKGDAADTFATGAYHFAIQVDDDPAFGSPATLISDVSLNNGDTSEATVAAAPVDLGQGVQTMLRFDANGATVPLVSNTAYTIRVFIYGVSAAGSASTQPYPTVALWDDIMFKLVSCGYDRGDAPAAYGDPTHKILGAIKMGAGDPDPELAAQAGANADGDDTNATDDENGVTLPTFIQGTSTSIQVTVSGAGYLQAWIDWNGNNTFDASEQIATDLQDNGVGDTNSNAGTITFNVTVPSDAVLTPTYARFRWSSTSGLNSTAAANDGEVEDYALTVDTAFVPTLPTAVCTMNAYGWVDTHIPVSTGGGEPSPPYYLTTGSYDWNQAGNPVWPNSKTPIQTLSGAVALALPDLSATDSLSANNEGWMTVTRLEGAPSSAGTIRMYDAGAAEHKVYLVKDALGNVLTRYPVAPSTSERNLGAVTLSFTYPTDGIAYVHVYVADYSGFRDVPYVTDCNQDRSDAPLVGTSYGEALHNILSTFYLGTQIDIDASTIANTAADGEGADDDGITLSNFARGQTVSISASVTGINGYLQAWMDWNGDGDFADAGEQIVTDMQDNGASDTNAATGQMTFTVSVPNDAVAAPTYARFRWSNVAGLDRITSALNGEVEDYQLVINATPEITSNGGGATASVSVAEGSTAVTTVTATDANITDTLIYSISGGADAAKLAIDANTGALSFVTAPNFATPSDADTNNVYEVQVTVSDGQATDVQDLSVTVTDVDAQVLEYTVRRTPDGRYHVYMRPTLNTVLGPNLSLTGQITLTVPTGIGANQFVVSDLQNLVPSVTWSQTSRTNAPVENTGTDYLSFTFTPNGSDQFNWQAGVELEVFNFANPNACMGMVDVMDDTDAFNALPNSVNSVPSNQFTNTGWGTPTDNNYLGNYGSPVDCVNNVAPLITSNGGDATASISVPENQTAVTTVTATDANATDILTYSITGGADAALFSIDPNTGVLSFDTAPNYEAPSDSGTNNSYDVQVSVSDGNSHSDVQDIAVTVTDVPEGVTIQVRGLLQGPFNASTGLMEDTLRTLSLIPSNQPYTIAPFNYSGAEVLNNTLLAVSGNDAIIDWVLVELRAAADPLTVVAQKAALLQRDGDVVMADTGALNIDFLGVNDGSYYVALRHRNHLGVMSASALALSPVPTVVDFTLPATAVYGTHARISAGSLALMWTADANKSNQVIANGPNNDTSDILGSVLMEGGNTLLNSNYKLLGYRVTDLDLNGITVFAGPNNDTNLLLGNVLLHPANSTFSANFVIHGGIPSAQ
ncbi:MAG: GEVED domain-containing protein [Thiofilum sp.]|uniref:GEVED domain-containing protein n=1 Tax=Thiofilum sp. TaxID=2212733 RepID=UPI0025D1EFBD|nr:GEVED domain-containing protein [Thiofilum sp.]